MSNATACCASVIILIVGPPSSAERPEARPKPVTITFRDLPPGPGPEGDYDFTFDIEVSGGGKVEVAITVPAGASPAAVALGFDWALRDVREWSGWRDGASVRIDGWTDPKTKAFQPVAAVSFRSTNLPRGWHPRIDPPAKQVGKK